MSPTCVHCEALTVWDDAVASSVCTSCGSLTDPSQSVLSDHTPLSHDHAPTTLKSLRSVNNWDLSGQGKEASDRRHAAAIADFINSLAATFNVPGLAPRAVTLFNQLKNVSNFRWGNRSRSIAAACLAVALRESNRPDALRDIASVLGVPPVSVTREFTRITASLGLSFTLVDPSVYVPMLQAHLSSLADHHKLPTSLAKPLGKLNFHSVSETAVLLSRLLARLNPGHEVLRLPVPPTACAIFTLAIEGDLRAPLNPLGDMASCLGARLQVAKAVVMTRYKTIQDEIASWIEGLPWLDKYEKRGGRSKVSKRLVVARGLRDVIQFQEDIWQKRSKLALPSGLLVEDDGFEQNQETKRAPKDDPKPNRAMARSIRFLLDPLGAPVPKLPPPSVSSSGAFPISQPSLATYLLTMPSTSLSGRPPTRLQLLACLRGGSSEDNIRDDELFAQGELENLLRDENEVQILREAFGWDEDEEARKLDKIPNCKRKRTEILQDSGIVTGSAFLPQKTRLNIEALARFMSDDCGTLDDSEQFMGLEEAIDEVDYESQNSDEADLKHDDEHPLPKRRRCAIPQSAQPSEDSLEEVVLEEWRPPSPGIGVTYNDSRYEEERPP